MKTQIKGVKIKGIASAVPSQTIFTDSYAGIFGEKKIKRIKRSTGVESVHIAPANATASDLCEAAAKRLMTKLCLTPADFDALVFVSISPDYRAPGTAGIMQHRMGFPSDAVALDLTFACSGYVYGLYVASMLLSSGGASRVLLFAGDTQSKLINEKDRSMKMLVGDAGTATILEKGDDDLYFYLKSVGEGYKHLIIPAGGCRKPSSGETRAEKEDDDGNIRSEDDLFMNGVKVMEFSLTEVPIAVEATLNMLQWKKSEVDFFAFHQPNKLILDYLQNSMEIDADKMPTGLQQYGNTAAASIPLLLSTLKERGVDFKTKEKIIACGFGLGLSIGAVNLPLADTVVLSPFEV